MPSDSYRSDPKRAAELAAVLTQHVILQGAAAKPYLIADAVMAMQKAARSAKRQAEHACNFGYRDDAHEARSMNRVHRAQHNVNVGLTALFGTDNVDVVPTIELGGDPRGPCARLHIPGQRGDGWGDGFAVY